MVRSKKLLDLGSAVTVAVTLVLFVLALFLKGLTHDLLLEAGVFLVSVKLILMGSKSAIAAETVERELAEIKALLAVARGAPGR